MFGLCKKKWFNSRLFHKNSVQHTKIKFKIFFSCFNKSFYLQESESKSKNKKIITVSINVSPESYNVLGDQNYASLRHLFGFTDEQCRIVKMIILYVWVVFWLKFLNRKTQYLCVWVYLLIKISEKFIFSCNYLEISHRKTELTQWPHHRWNRCKETKLELEKEPVDNKLR